MARRDSAKPTGLCGVCYWWRTRYAGTSCKADGVKATDKPCSNFEHRDVADWPVRLRFAKATVDALAEVEYPDHLEREVNLALAELRRLQLPKRLRTDADARKAQEVVATASALHSRMPDVISKVQATRNRAGRLRYELASHISMLKPIEDMKTRTDKDVVIGRACLPLDTMLERLDTLLYDAKRVMSASSEAVKNAEVLTRLTYAVRERV